ncbi:MAG TPA: ABC transporter permease [Solirubrobacteraceae bacterium]|jgi:ABC-2 type transport system permease protein|nr:ABC transporter permease [Solirubrobacteraceae bacterium]
MSGATSYTRYELLRTFRNRRFLVFSLAIPLVIYAAFAIPNRNDHDFNGSGIPFALYYMVSLASFGTMMAMVSSGARIAGERATGWTRQLRITPLSTRAYFQAKILTAYVMAATSITGLFVFGIALGVRMPLGDWLQTVALLLIGLLPFAALGVMLGHLLNVDSMGPATGGIVSLLAFLGGTWAPVASHGFLHVLALALPSYWLVQASHVSLGGSGWGTTGWLIVAGWAIVLTRLARYAYRRDTNRL